MSSIGNERDWVSVAILGICWGIAMYAFAYIRRRKLRTSLARFTLRAHVGMFLYVAFLSFDFGFLTTFWSRSFRGHLLFILVAANVALVFTVLGFRLLSPISTQR